MKNGPLAHLPSGRFTADAAWLVCAAISHNLTRAAGALAGGRHTRARAATLRARLITIPGCVAHSAHRQTLAPTSRLALGTRPGQTAAQHPARPLTRSFLTTAPHGRPETQWKSRTDRRLNHAHSRSQLQ